MAELVYDKTGRLIFTKEMKEEYTILLPMMAKIHFNILKNVFVHYGYKVVLLETEGPEIAQVGLKYVHNDTCYPALLVIGQFIHALQSEKVPVISLNLSGLEKNSGFHMTIPMIRRLAAGLIYGDMLMSLDNQVKPYEINKGDSAALIQKWTDKLTDILAGSHGFRRKEIAQNLDEIAEDYSKIKIKKVPKVKVGIVGEIYVKYSSLGNNNLEQFLYDQDCEVNMPGMMGFMMFKIDNRLEDYKLYGGSRLKYIVVEKLLNYLKELEQMVVNSQIKYSFTPITKYEHTKKLVKGVVGYGSKMGEGWLLTGEMLELVESGFENIVCTQPFGCLPNHINGKGMIRQIKQMHSNANIVAIDYDPGAPRVNQENRIKLMLAVAREQLKNSTPNETATPKTVKVKTVKK